MFTAIKGIKLVVNAEHQNKLLKTCVNFRRLTNYLLGKLNDPKEVVRNEIERVIIDISKYMNAKDLVL